MKQYLNSNGLVPALGTSNRALARASAYGALLGLCQLSLAGACLLGCDTDADLPKYGTGTSPEGAAPKPEEKPTQKPEPSVSTPPLNTQPEAELPGDEIIIKVPADGTAYVNLAALTSLSVDAEAEKPADWDIAFHGLDVFTNSGASGPGEGGGFGPNEELDFLFDDVPSVPFLREDVTGGAFLGWYYYDGSVHQLWSLNDVYAVKSGEHLYKVQILSYYGEQLGAPVSALYEVRYAEVLDDGSAETQTIAALDGTAGYPKIDDSKPSGCLQLASGDVKRLTPDEARASTDWDLCFRRDSISVNGELGGPGNVGAVPVTRVLKGWDGSLEAVKALTPDQASQGFDGVDYATLSDPNVEYRGDRIISIFSGNWLTRNEAGDIAPAPASWLVRGQDGLQFYSIIMRDVASDSSGVRQVTLRVHALAGAKK